jgi:hypothetical protein
MIRVDCHFGRYRANLRDTGVTFQTLKFVIENDYAVASQTASGLPNVQIQALANRFNVPVAPPSVPTDMLNLQAALRLLIGNQPPDPQPRRAGILLADRFAPRPSLLGLMFDVGFTPGDRAREGCAIFLDAIHAQRADEGPAAYANEVRFTCMHELGHVFNLWHQPQPLNYLSSSGEPGFPPSAHQFSALHRRYLQQDAPALREFIAPGGTDFGRRIPGFPSEQVPHAENGSSVDDSWLEIRGPIHPFAYFEPVELELSLHTRRIRPSAWPDQLDPGYDNFAIWIEEPAGERRRYRSLKHFMPNSGQIHVSKQEPFRRDISLFGESGGYTFRRAGVHRVWVTFNASARRHLRSNVIEIEVLNHPMRDKIWRRSQEVLTRGGVASLLFYRSGKLSAADRDAISYMIRRQKKTLGAAGLHYALGRRLAGRLLHTRQRRREDLTTAIEHLKRSTDSKELNAHRRNLAAELIQLLTALRAR